jgi:hypothetical protein
MIPAPAFNSFPSKIFEIGSVIEDQTAVMKILHFAPCRSGHSYKVEVLRWKRPPPDNVKEHLNEKAMWIFVSADSVGNITSHE